MNVGSTEMSPSGGVPSSGGVMLAPGAGSEGAALTPGADADGAALPDGVGSSARTAGTIAATSASESMTDARSERLIVIPEVPRPDRDA